MKSLHRVAFAVATLIALCASAPVAPAQTYSESVLYSFCSKTNCTDGINPTALTLDSAGNLYGIATGGGTGVLDGTAFKLTSSSVLTVLHEFCPSGSETCADGNVENSGLLLASNGDLYGTTYRGGTNNGGVFYQLTTSGDLTPLYNFCTLSNCADGYDVNGFLIQGSDSNLYGTAQAIDGNDTSSPGGTIFQLTTGGGYKLLYNFCPANSLPCSDGYYPNAPLVEGADDNYYGTTQYGGANGYGTVFRVTAAGKLTTLYSFTGGADGANPQSGLTLGSDGFFYGTTGFGGASGMDYGAIFKLTSSGTLLPLYSFCNQTNCTDGIYPIGPLLQASDGNFYGVASQGGTANSGAVFKITPSGTYLVVYSLGATDQDAAFPSSGLVQATHGTLYGSTANGGAQDEGAVYAITGLKAKANIAFSAAPYPLSVGQTVTLSATVSGVLGDPTGAIVFSSAGAKLCSGTLSAGAMSCTVSTNSLPPGAYVVTVTYSGDTVYNTISVSANAALDAAPTSVTLTADPNPVTPPTNVTLTAKVKRSATGATGTPTGSISFLVGATVLTKTTLNSSGVATYTAATSGVAPGSYSITAHYNGDKSDSSSTSSAVVVMVK